MNHCRQSNKHQAPALIALAGLILIPFISPKVTATWATSGTATRPVATPQSPARSKANGKIAFVSGRDTDKLDIYVMNPDGTDITRLTDGTSYNEDPAWSPDGTKLAFTSLRAGGFRIYVTNADGSNVRRLTDSTESEVQPVWSPDGTRIAYAKGFIGGCAPPSPTCPGPDIYVTNADGSNERRLTDDRTGNNSPTWSPDSTKIAFASRRDGNGEINVMNADGSNRTNITNNPAMDIDPDWSPDGARIAFASTRSENHCCGILNYEIYSMNPDGSRIQRLTDSPTVEHANPVWSPDGTMIAFHGRLINGIRFDDFDIYVMNADGSNQRPITTDTFEDIRQGDEQDIQPAWQPLLLGTNGKITFTSERDGNAEIYSMNAGNGQVNLTNHPARDFNPVYSPDGTKIAFTSDRNNATFDLFVMNADGSNPTRITRYSEVFCCAEAFEPAWSPDGTKIVYVSPFMRVELPRLVVINADGSGAMFIDNATQAYDPAWSPDGTRIAFIGHHAAEPFEREAFELHLYSINTDGGGRTRITNVPVVAPDSSFSPDLAGPTWSPDGVRLAFASNRDGNAEIYVVSASGGSEAVRLTNNPAQDTLPVWSPDGTKIGFTSDRDGNREIYVTDANGSNPTRITNNPAYDYDPDWQQLEPRAALPPTLATLQFSAIIYRAPEQGTQTTPPMATVTVTRLGDVSREASVDYTTRDACNDTPGAPACIRTASERSDYITTAGRLRFGSGETAKSFNVILINDLTVEGDEILNLELSNAAGAGLGGQSKATLVILDDDTTPTPVNPIDRRAFFIRQHYLDFLNREPDEAGFQFWINQIPAECDARSSDALCVEARLHVSAAFFLSIEFQQTGYLVYRMHKAAFDRLPRLRDFLPDVQKIGRDVVVGAPGWEQQLEANKQTFALEFVTRPAFVARYPGEPTPAQFVGALATNTGSSLSQGERDALIAELTQAGNTAQGRASVLRKVAEDSDFAQAEFNRAFVLMQYFGYLRRNPDDAPDHNFDGYNFWLNKLNQFDGNFIASEMVKAFVTSGEYRRRFVQ